MSSRLPRFLSGVLDGAQVVLADLAELAGRASTAIPSAPAAPLTAEERRAREADLALLDGAIKATNDAMILAQAEVLILERLLEITKIDPPDRRDDAFMEELRAAAATIHAEHARQKLLATEMKSRRSNEETLYLPEDFSTIAPYDEA